MEVKSNLKLYGNLSFEHNFTEFPEDPELGTIIRKDDRLCIYELVDGEPTWHYIGDATGGGSNALVYIHNQDEESDTWVVQHNYALKNYFYDVVDLEGRHILANPVSDESGNTVTLKFNKPYSGRALFLFINNTPIKINTSSSGFDYLFNVRKIITSGQYSASNRDCFIIHSSDLTDNVEITLNAEKDATVVIKNFASGEFKVFVNSGNYFIDDFSNVYLESGSSVTLVCDGENWYTISGFIKGVEQ